MPYAEGRIYNDADSHLMETHDWLTPYADPQIRELRVRAFEALLGRRVVFAGHASMVGTASHRG